MLFYSRVYAISDCNRSLRLCARMPATPVTGLGGITPTVFSLLPHRPFNLI